MNTKQNTSNSIPKLIKDYAKVYSRFENMQEEYDSLQNGNGKDQKTGVIGEYYAYMYLQYKGLEPEYANSREPWDITAYKKNKRKCKYQIKTVSSYSRFKALSTIYKGWDMLVVIYLNKSFEPEQSWEISVKEFEKHYKYGQQIRLDAKSPGFARYYKKYLLPPGWWKAESTKEGGTTK